MAPKHFGNLTIQKWLDDKHYKHEWYKDIYGFYCCFNCATVIYYPNFNPEEANFYCRKKD